MRKPSAKQKIRDFLRANLGKVVSSKQLRDAAGNVTEWARRTRELREKEGWRILTHHDDAILKPGEYLLKETPPEPGTIDFEPDISAKLRAVVLDRNGFTCQMCGLTPGDVDPQTGRPVRLHIGHVKDRSLKGETDPNNLRTLCSTCNQGAKNVTAEKPSVIWLLAQIRRAGVADQRAVYDFLKRKFG